MEWGQALTCDRYLMNVMNVNGGLLLLVAIFLYLFNAALKFRLVGYSLFIISMTCSYVRRRF
jgi:hypothetical protein